jgi:hypothetical protein
MLLMLWSGPAFRGRVSLGEGKKVRLTIYADTTMRAEDE